MLGESKILKEIRDGVNRLIALLQLEFNLVPAKRLILLQNQGGNLSTAAFSLVAGVPGQFVIVPLPAGSTLGNPADLELTCSDPAVELTQDLTTDPTGATWDVEVPTSDPTTSINLNATGVNSAGAAISGGPFPVAVTPAAPPPPPPPSPATALGLTQNSGQAPTSTASTAAAAKTAAPASAAAATKARAPVK
jgi:hypothetical protein